MWNRAELKEKAKSALKQNYWKIVLVAILAGLVGGGTTSGLNLDTSSFEESFSEGFESGFDAGYESDEYYDESYDEDYGFDDLEDDFTVDEDFMVEDEDVDMGAGIVVALAVMAILWVVIIIVTVVQIFVYYPLEIGTNRYFLKSLSQKAEVKEIAFAYDNGYKNVIKILFLRNLYTALWSLLFVIPGVVKGYEYQMIPYLLAENPNLSKDEAFRLSKQMMSGNKWDAFVLDWSFFGWDILSGFTLGILNILYVQPYKYLTYAALYEELSAINGYPARASLGNAENVYQQANPYEQPVQPEYTYTETNTTDNTYNSPE